MALGALWSSRKNLVVHQRLQQPGAVALLQVCRVPGRESQCPGGLGRIWPSSFPQPATLMPYGFKYLLPVGISFFTFQSLSYTIDFYLGNVPRERNFLRFATFVCFFPQLMAGPIERAKHLLPQYQTFPEIRLQNFTDGASLFLVGLFKKLALANYLSLLRRAGLRQSGRLRRPGAARGDLRFRLADLLRFQRLHRHGPRRGQGHGLQPDPELSQSLPGHRHRRVLDPLAHQPLLVVPGLRLHPAGREPLRQAPDLPQSAHHLRRLRDLARGLAGRFSSGACCTAWA